MSFLRIFAVLCALCSLAPAQWVQIGPEGGDARSLAYDPRFPDRIYLGTASGVLFVSNDHGNSWRRFAQVGAGRDLVLDNISVSPADSRVIYVAAWNVERHNGDLFRTQDGGATWRALPGVQGKSIRALAIAPSDPKLLVIGALDGVFRSSDGGETWERISPEGHAEIRNVESVAIDPADPNVIYIGTWHLPWKTADGGKTWQWIKNGVQDDSDVFSIIVDPRNRDVVYASACSGIYKSENGAALFHRVMGMPKSAQRTRTLAQDPRDSRIVYAGTTQGLWKTTDSGKTFRRMGPANLIVNDVHIDPRHPSRVLLATDRGGVVASDDGGASWHASNRGFSHRQVSAVAADLREAATLYAGVVNDKEFGGVFVSRDSGASWVQISEGIGDRDVFSLGQAFDYTLFAGTNRGLFTRTGDANAWQPVEQLPADARVNALLFGEGRSFAATSAGLFVSDDNGANWTLSESAGEREFVALAVAQRTLLAATRDAVRISLDGGEHWYEAGLNHNVAAIQQLAIAPDGVLWIAARSGAWRSPDAGDSWFLVSGGLPAHDVSSLAFDGRRVLAVVGGAVYQSLDRGRTWNRMASEGLSLRSLLNHRGRMIATTAFDGLITDAPVETPAPSVSGTGGAAQY